MEQIFVENSDMFVKLLLAVFLGALIGLERVLVHKEAGMKTHALVALGSALFIIISEAIALKYSGLTDFDASRIASQVVVGIGFLGAGSIMLKGSYISGLTTASGLWVTAGIGMAVGFGLYTLAISASILVLLVFVLMSIFERPIKKIIEENNKEN
jgi:putative Mg2+ transporter-C (MgtC) family protein